MELVQVKMPDGTWQRVPSIVGPKGDPYTLTDADKAEIAQQAAALIPVQKIQIDYLGNKVFKMGDQDLNFADIYNYHITAPNFTFIVYGDRAYLCSFINVDDTTKEMRFESVINSDNRTKVSSIYITSNDGVNIASVSTANINSENSSNKVNEITEANEDSTDKYPSLAAIKPIREGIAQSLKTPAEANVGQMFVVKSKNADGSVVLEAVDSPDLTDYVKNTDYPTGYGGKPGIINTWIDYGLTNSHDGTPSSRLQIAKATYALISNRNSSYRPIVPDNLVHAVNSVLCSTDENEQLTAEQQIAARQRLGINDYELVESITLTSDAESIVRTAYPNGTPYKFKNVMLFVYIPAGSRSGTNIPRARGLLNGQTLGYINAQTIGASNAAYCFWQIDVFSNMYKIASNGGDYNDTIAPRYTRWPTNINSGYIDGIEMFLHATAGYKYPAGTKLDIFAVKA